MKPFFTKEQTVAAGITKIPQSCASCGLSKTAVHGRMKPWGNGEKKILIIAGSPNKHNDRRQRPWSDSEGDLMKWAFKQHGINIQRDCLTSYACICPSQGKLDDRQISCCRRKILPLIKEFKPKMIFLVDDGAIKSIIGQRWQKGLANDDGVVSKWRGWVIPDREHKTWLAPIFSPGYIRYKEERNGKNLAKLIWLQDIDRALKKLDETFHFENELKYLTHITDDRQFKDIMARLIKADLMSFDYEGTGLKPHGPGHQITTVSACIGPKEGYVWDHTPERLELWRKVLQSHVAKSAHNMGFEHLWSRVIMKAKVMNWHWDSMNNAHIIDNRPGIVGLKFQTYANFGLVGYDDEIGPYLKGKDSKNANSHNQILDFIKKYGSKTVRDYCGLDSIYGYMLTILQMEIMGKMK